MNTRRTARKREPVRKKNGTQHVVTVTPGDEEIFKLHGVHGLRYLRSDHIAAFTGRSQNVIAERLDQLTSPPNCYLYRPTKQWKRVNAMNQHRLYALDENGEKHLKKLGYQVKDLATGKQFAHSVMESEIAASFMLGQTETVRIIRWPAIQKSDQFPHETRKLPNPFCVPAGEYFIEPDFEPFIVARGGESFTFLPGFEADCGTEPLTSKDEKRSSIERKFRLYLRALSEGSFRRHFGARTVFIPFIAPDPQRMNAMKDVLRSLEPGEWAQCFGFQFVPLFDSHLRQKPATGHMLETDYERVDYPPLNLMVG